MLWGALVLGRQRARCWGGAATWWPSGGHLGSLQPEVSRKGSDRSSPDALCTPRTQKKNCCPGWPQTPALPLRPPKQLGSQACATVPGTATSSLPPPSGALAGRRCPTCLVCGFLSRDQRSVWSAGGSGPGEEPCLCGFHREGVTFDPAVW